MATSALRFGPYELARRLGAGGMAETFLAIRRGPGGFEQHVCVKRILPSLVTEPDFVRQFMEEARLAAQLRHANIAQVVDFGAHEGSNYLALELVDGMDLRALLKRVRERKLSLGSDLVAYIATALTSALDFAHTPMGVRPAVAHRDISPSNVLVSRSGEVYLTDFGIARVLGSKRRTESGVVRGKVPYMAPEYALHATFDQRSDIFSLGVVLFESLAGQRPFDGATDLDTLQRIAEGRRPSLGALRPDASVPLVRAIERMLAPDPNYRFQSAAEVLQALVPCAAPPTAPRLLGELVRSSSESLAASLRLSTPSETAPVGAGAAPAYPQVIEAPSDLITRTSQPPLDRTVAETGETPATVRPGEKWSSTDPGYVSHHGGQPTPPHKPAIAQPIAQQPIAPQPVPQKPAIAQPQPKVDPSYASHGGTAPASFHPAIQPRSVPPTIVQPPLTPAPQPVVPAPEPSGSRPLLWLFIGMIAFAAAGAAGYFVVEAVRTGALHLPWGS
jgi:eukaryotic-like serine/threonine-protein kinase